MKTTDATLLFVPGLGGAGPEHWLSRWQKKLSTARRVEQRDWDTPAPTAWAAALVEAAAAAQKPVVILAHGLGATTTVIAAAQLAGRVAGAMLVTPPSLARGFTDVPLDPLPFPSLVFASRNDVECSFEEAADMALSWGSALVDAGDAGHIDEGSGHGPWPEGLMRFAGFLAKL